LPSFILKLFCRPGLLSLVTFERGFYAELKIKKRKRACGVTFQWSIYYEKSFSQWRYPLESVHNG